MIAMDFELKLNNYKKQDDLSSIMPDFSDVEFGETIDETMKKVIVNNYKEKNQLNKKLNEDCKLLIDKFRELKTEYLEGNKTNELIKSKRFDRMCNKIFE